MDKNSFQPSVYLRLDLHKQPPTAILNGTNYKRIMGSHPINLTVRFLLEISALVSAGLWGWKQSDGWLRFFLAIGIPIILAAIWGTFAVPNDPSRSGSAPIITPGIIRFAIEIGVFTFATWSLYDLGLNKLSLALGIIVVLHYIISYDRIMWLMSQ
ncbi:MAG: hypothetical protein ACI8QD_001980 [Cyclobacteriaceae bacterium]|jgi:hypothetical protein